MKRAVLWLLAALALPLFAAPRPKLIVLIVAEQFRPEYLERLRPAFGPGGFNRLLKGGAVFRECRYEHLATFPASGAAVLATGAYPERHGIVGEYWYDRKTRRVVRAAEDLNTTLAGSPLGTRVPGASPHHLAVPTLADELRLASGGRGGRTVSISLRDQTAVMLGGFRPAGCYWMDDAARFVTSSYYRDTLPSWAAAFQQGHQALRYRGRPWKALDGPESAPPLRVLDGQGADGVRDFLATYLASPLALEDQFDFARETVESEGLGNERAPDLLVLSLSSLYLLGLETGADSPLVRDMVLRLDRKLEEFFIWLDARLGPEQTWIVFTATQGLPSLTETLKVEGLPAGRVAGEQIVQAVNTRLAALFGRGSYVEKYIFPSLYLRPESVPPERFPDLARAAGEAALNVAGVAAYRAVPAGPGVLTPEAAALFARSLFPGRSGDVVLAYQPNYGERYGEGRGVSTGSYYGYDTRVPLLLYGAAFRAQTFDRPVQPIDLAATLAAALDIAPPAASTGRVLVEALKER